MVLNRQCRHAWNCAHPSVYDFNITWTGCAKSTKGFERPCMSDGPFPCCLLTVLCGPELRIASRGLFRTPTPEPIVRIPLYITWTGCAKSTKGFERPCMPNGPCTYRMLSVWSWFVWTGAAHSLLWYTSIPNPGTDCAHPSIYHSDRLC